MFNLPFYQKPTMLKNKVIVIGYNMMRYPNGKGVNMYDPLINEQYAKSLAEQMIAQVKHIYNIKDSTVAYAIANLYGCTCKHEVNITKILNEYDAFFGTELGNIIVEHNQEEKPKKNKS